MHFQQCFYSIMLQNLINLTLITYYSGSETKFNILSTSWRRSEEIKLFPSGSKLLNTLRATSVGVSALTNCFSNENKTVKWVSLPNTHTGELGFFRKEPTSQYLRCSRSARNPTLLCLLIPRSSGIKVIQFT